MPVEGEGTGGEVGARSMPGEIAALKARVEKLSNAMPTQGQHGQARSPPRPGEATPEKSMDRSAGKGVDRSELLRLKARAEMLSKRMESTSKQVAAAGHLRSSQTRMGVDLGTPSVALADSRFSPQPASPASSANPAAAAKDSELARFLPSSSSSDDDGAPDSPLASRGSQARQLRQKLSAHGLPKLGIKPETDEGTPHDRGLPANPSCLAHAEGQSDVALAAVLSPGAHEPRDTLTTDAIGTSVAATETDQAAPAPGAAAQSFASPQLQQLDPKIFSGIFEATRAQGTPPAAAPSPVAVAPQTPALIAQPRHSPDARGMGLALERIESPSPVSDAGPEGGEDGGGDESREWGRVEADVLVAPGLGPEDGSAQELGRKVVHEPAGFPSWTVVSQDPSGNMDEFRNLFSPQAAGGGRAAEPPLHESIVASPVPDTPLLAKTELVTLLADLMASKEHGCSLSLSLSHDSSDSLGPTNRSLNRSGEEKSMASVSKAIVAVEMARLAPDPRQHMIDLLSDLQGPSAVGDMVGLGSGPALKTAANSQGVSVTDRCLTLLALAYPADFAQGSGDFSSSPPQKQPPGQAGATKGGADKAQNPLTSTGSKKLTMVDAASFLRSRFGGDSSAELVTPGDSGLQAVDPPLVCPSPGDGPANMSLPTVMEGREGEMDMAEARDAWEQRSLPIAKEDGGARRQGGLLGQTWLVKRSPPSSAPSSQRISATRDVASLDETRSRLEALAAPASTLASPEGAGAAGRGEPGSANVNSGPDGTEIQMSAARRHEDESEAGLTLAPTPGVDLLPSPLREGHAHGPSLSSSGEEGAASRPPRPGGMANTERKPPRPRSGQGSNVPGARGSARHAAETAGGVGLGAGGQDQSDGVDAGYFVDRTLQRGGRLDGEALDEVQEEARLMAQMRARDGAVSKMDISMRLASARADTQHWGEGKVGVRFSHPPDSVVQVGDTSAADANGLDEVGLSFDMEKFGAGDEDGGGEESAACTSPAMLLVLPALASVLGLGACATGVVLLAVDQDRTHARDTGGTPSTQRLIATWLETLGAATFGGAGGGLVMDCALAERGGAVRVMRYGLAVAVAVSALTVRGATLTYSSESDMLVLAMACMLLAAAVSVLYLPALLRYKRAARFGPGWFFGQSVASGDIHSLCAAWALVALLLGLVLMSAGLAAAHVSMDNGALLQLSPATTAATRAMHAYRRRTLVAALVTAVVGAVQSTVAVTIGSGVSVPSLQNAFYTRALPGLMLLSSIVFFTVYVSIVFLAS